MKELAVTPTSARSRRVLRLLAGIALTAHFLLAIDAGGRQSVTFDEYWHLPVGVLNWRTGRFDFEPLNPPLARLWSALPAIGAGGEAAIPEPDRPLHDYGHWLVQADPEHFFAWYRRGRMMQALLSAAIGLFLVVWQIRMFGDAAGCLTALLWSFSPNILANASIVSTDLAATGAFLFVLAALWRHARHASPGNSALAGLALGLALLCKFTCLALIPLAPLCWACFRQDFLRSGQPEPQFPDAASPAPIPASSPSAAAALPAPARTTLSWKSLARDALIIATIACLVLNAGYLFRGTGSPLGAYRFQSHALRSVMDRVPALNRLPAPLPRDFLVGLDRQRAIMEQPHPVYLDREWSLDGFPSYYLRCYAYKLTHGLQLLLLLAAWLLVRPNGPPTRGWLLAGLLLPAVLLTTVASVSSMQLGLRYVLPSLPLFMIVAGQAARWANAEHPRVRRVVVGLVVLTAASLRFHPHHLAYFNELAGGPESGREHLIDSNLDWGQDLYRLRDWMRANGQRTIGLAYFGTAPPTAVGIEYRLPAGWQPEPGVYAVSVNFLQGRPGGVADANGAVRAAGLDEFGYFRAFEPIARLGYSIHVFRISPLDVLEWRAAQARPPEKAR